MDTLILGLQITRTKLAPSSPLVAGNEPENMHYFPRACIKFHSCSRHHLTSAMCSGTIQQNEMKKITLFFIASTSYLNCEYSSYVSHIACLETHFMMKYAPV